MKNIMSRWLAILALSLFLLSGCSSDSSGTGTATVPPDESAIVTENPEKSDSDESLTQDLGLTSDHIGKPEQSEPQTQSAPQTPQPLSFRRYPLPSTLPRCRPSQVMPTSQSMGMSPTSTIQSSLPILSKHTILWTRWAAVVSPMPV